MVWATNSANYLTLICLLSILYTYLLTMHFFQLFNLIMKKKTKFRQPANHLHLYKRRRKDFIFFCCVYSFFSFFSLFNFTLNILRCFIKWAHYRMYSTCYGISGKLVNDYKTNCALFCGWAESVPKFIYIFFCCWNSYHAFYFDLLNHIGLHTLEEKPKNKLHIEYGKKPR